ncbi:hypothetical protein GDO81_007795 [Engystomops pustulosus]|uniref:Uncharacterized protein n=1 Tax=Engystomops pustulosus TaxID=76066 RepID=A0AAV7CBI2_ENGPU|nr:hypothetical protein GDO81_007795 [Engystomops pustulosus]
MLLQLGWKFPWTSGCSSWVMVKQSKAIKYVTIVCKSWNVMLQNIPLKYCSSKLDFIKCYPNTAFQSHNQVISSKQCRKNKI